MIRSFRSPETEEIFHRQFSRQFQPSPRWPRGSWINSTAPHRWDLAGLPGNRLEALAGDRAGQHSIRTNDQWRICFRWKDGEPHDVEIVDYH